MVISPRVLRRIQAHADHPDASLVLRFRGIRPTKNDANPVPLLGHECLFNLGEAVFQ
jgi:hypothetical protein